MESNHCELLALSGYFSIFPHILQLVRHTGLRPSPEHSRPYSDLLFSNIHKLLLPFFHHQQKRYTL